MFMKKLHRKRTPEEKEKLIKDIQQMGVIAGCRFYGVSKVMYYDWLTKYTSRGLEGLKDRRSQSNEAIVKKLEKENQALKELLAEERLASKMKDDLLKKKFAQQKKRGSS
jgi:putative transposase